MTDKRGVARQIVDAHGRVFMTKGPRVVGTDKKGRPIYKQVMCTLWDLDGYETIIPCGYVPIYEARKDKWYYTKEGGPDDPFRQLGFIRDQSMPFEEDADDF